MIDGTAKADGAKLGTEAAEAILQARADDGSATPDAYRPVTAPGVYVPTPNMVAPQWPNVKPFVTTSASQFRAPPPPSLDSDQWAKDYGRGFGKTRCGSEWVQECVQTGIATRIGLVGPTAGDVRDVMVEGPARILSIAPSWLRPEYEPSKRRLTWPSGAIATMFSAEEADRLRGPQHDLLWADELAAWQNCQDTWDMAMFGLRLGSRPRWLVTMTPKPVRTLRDLLSRVGQDVVLTKGSTFDNAANLAPSFLAAIKQRYENTRLGRQELHAERLTDTPGALWRMDQIDATRLPAEGAPLWLNRIVVAVDPAVSTSEGSDETGVVACGIDEAGRFYVIDDQSGRYAPHEWAQRAINTYHRWSADRIVIEANQGGAMVESTLRQVDPNVPVRTVNASRGKVTRAEPFSALYEQGRVSHVGSFPELEDQMCAFTSDFNRNTAGYSPDRVDALVWALTSLSGPEPPTFTFAGEENYRTSRINLTNRAWTPCFAQPWRPGDQDMRIFKRGDKPATVTESASALGDSFFDRLLRQQQSRKSDLRNPLTGDPFDPCERYNPDEVKLR